MTPRRVFLGLVALGLLLVLAGPVRPAAQSCFIKIDGVPGESQDKDHKGWIDILSYDFSPAPQAGRRRSAGPGRLSITVRMDKSVPKLHQYCSTGSRFAKGTLSCYKSKGERRGYVRYWMTGLLVSSYETGAAGDQPTENITFNYEKIRWRWVPSSSGRKHPGR